LNLLCDKVRVIILIVVFRLALLKILVYLVIVLLFCGCGRNYLSEKSEIRIVCSWHLHWFIDVGSSLVRAFDFMLILLHLVLYGVSLVLACGFVG